MLSATLQFLITMIACAINERMQRKLDYTQEEVRVLKEVVAAITGNGRLSFTADQRRRLAVAGKALSPNRLQWSARGLGPLASADHSARARRPARKCRPSATAPEHASATGVHQGRQAAAFWQAV
jgi:hypothetical protein